MARSERFDLARAAPLRRFIASASRAFSRGDRRDLEAQRGRGRVLDGAPAHDQDSLPVVVCVDGRILQARGRSMTAGGRVTRAARAELRRLPADLRSSALAAAVVELAGRLDAEPSDREAAAITRELRLALADLHARAAAQPEEGVIDVGVASMGN